MDNIKPNHYLLDNLNIEVYDILKSVLSDERVAGFYLGNVIKYILRAEKKNGIEDYKKALEYLKLLIEKLEKDNEEYIF